MTSAVRRAVLPSVTADQMREVDRIVVEEVGLQLVQMMENAGRHLAALAVDRFAPRSCTVVVGSGGNGGGGMVAARHLIDAVLGYGVRGDPAGRAGSLVQWMATGTSPVVSLDVPSGLDPTTGEVGHPCVHAAVTLTLGLPKRGLLRAPASVTGPVHTADVGIPDWVYRRVGVEVEEPFRAGPVVPTVLN